MSETRHTITITKSGHYCHTKTTLVQRNCTSTIFL